MAIEETMLNPLVSMIRVFQKALLLFLIAPTLWAANISMSPIEDDSSEIKVDNGQNQYIYRIDSSDNLYEWWPIFAEFGPDWNQAVDIGPSESQHFFKVTESDPLEVTPHSSWKNSIDYPDDPFRKTLSTDFYFSFDDEPLSLIKFIILLDDLDTVYFQNSNDYEFHYNFAADRLEPFSGLSASEFNLQTLYGKGLKAILGNVIFAPEFNEYGIQFVVKDPLPQETILFLYNLVDQAINQTSNAQGFYTPTYEQTESALNQEQLLALNGINVSSFSKWETGNSGYNSGWAVGKLVFIPGDEIEDAYENGTLTANDILLTDHLPAEVPYVQGIVTLTAAGANSHVAILAEASGIPFGFASEEDLQDQFLALVGKEVILSISAQYSSLTGTISVREFPSTLPNELRDEVLARKALPELEIQAIETLGEYIQSVDLLVPADIKYFGGKAANFGYLRRSIPENSPEAIAFSFDLWLEFLEQNIGDTSLKSQIDTLLKKYTWPVTNIAQLYDDLDTIRDMIEDDSQFTVTQEAMVLEALEVFYSEKKIRFRSSTNVEDSQYFVGAGLYESHSGCLLDDLDDDDIGPSICDSSKDNERGVFRAIRKVYASFYNDNAFLERLRYGVDESKVGMALLVHHSFPDEIELANGVVRAEYSNFNNYRQLKIYLTTQVGANSVTNPEEGMIPEIVLAQVFTNRTYFYVNQRSNLLLLGDTHVMKWESEYSQLSDLLVEAIDEFLSLYPDREEVVLDFEYKKLAPDDTLIVKQIREIPQYSGGEGLPWILDSTPSNAYRIHQGEGGGDVFALHRLKSVWKFSAKNKLLNESGLSTSLLKTITWQHANSDQEVVTVEGDPSQWEGAAYELKDGYSPNSSISVNSWSFEPIDDIEATLSLSGQFNDLPASNENPIKTAQGFDWRLTAQYDTDILAIDQLSNATFGTTQQDYANLELTPSDEIPFNAIPKEYAFTSSDKQISVDIKYWWPDGPGPVNGYTAPLLQWDRTIITGLTTTPITLSGYFSQTYKPEHHNFGEWFLFEPALEEGISEQQKTELANANIKQILVFTDDVNRIWTIDSAGNATEN
ncbi:hypothetical protein MLD52_01390 [Puniceicoccaceae bacterium K14]|nr:hypothetical protein [Puniceicoccaceae bacterium K14]